MKVTLELSTGDLADLQEILAENIVRISKRRTSGRVTPGQMFLLCEQQKILSNVNQQLHAAATDSPLALPCAVTDSPLALPCVIKMEKWSDMKALKNDFIVRTEKEVDMVRAARIDETKLHVRYLPGFKLYNVEDVRALLRRPKTAGKETAL